MVLGMEGVKSFQRDTPSRPTVATTKARVNVLKSGSVLDMLEHHSPCVPAGVMAYLPSSSLVTYVLFSSGVGEGARSPKKAGEPPTGPQDPGTARENQTPGCGACTFDLSCSSGL